MMDMSVLIHFDHGSDDFGNLEIGHLKSGIGNFSPVHSSH